MALDLWLEPSAIALAEEPNESCGARQLGSSGRSVFQDFCASLEPPGWICKPLDTGQSLVGFNIPTQQAAGSGFYGSSWSLATLFLEEAAS